MSENVGRTFEPHQGTPDFPGGQVRLIALTLAFRTVVATVGRRWGKTQAAMMAILEHYRLPKWVGRRFIAAYCGPTYKSAKRQYDEAKEFFGNLIDRKSDTELWIKLKPINGNLGGLVHFWSLEESDNLRGARLDFCVIDEAKDVKEMAYVAVLRPMLMDTAGHMLIIGTPSPEGVGFMWFRTEFRRGDDPDYPDHACMKGPSEGNPYMDRAILRTERANCASKIVERSEFDAEFVDGEGAVFERIDEACVLPYTSQGQHIHVGRGAAKGREYLIGYDVGRHDDWGVISCFDEHANEQVYVERMLSMPFEQQLEHLTLIKSHYNDAVVYADNNGMGEAVFERLALKFGEGIVGRKWNHARKEADISRGMMLFQRAAWKFLRVKWQTDAFQAYIRVRLPAGGYRYEASAGYKDDPVVASCLIAPRLVLPKPKPEELKIRHNMFDADGNIDFKYWTDREDDDEDDDEIDFFI